MALGTFTTLDGLSGTVSADSAEADHSSQVTLTCNDGRSLRVARNVLRAEKEGSWLLPVSSDQFAALVGNDARAVNIPIFEENLDVQVHPFISGKVRVSTHTKTREESIDIPLVQEHIDIERIPVNRQIDKAVAPYQEGDTWIIPVMEEVLVVEKRLMLREEIRLTTRRIETRHTQSVSLRSTEAAVERIATDAQPQ